MNENRRPSILARKREEDRLVAGWQIAVEEHGEDSAQAAAALERATDVTVELDMLYDARLPAVPEATPAPKGGRR